MKKFYLGEKYLSAANINMLSKNRPHAYIDDSFFQLDNSDKLIILNFISKWIEEEKRCIEELCNDVNKKLSLPKLYKDIDGKWLSSSHNPLTSMETEIMFENTISSQFIKSPHIKSGTSLEFQERDDIRTWVSDETLNKKNAK
jgi:hypothetical protein